MNVKPGDLAIVIGGEKTPEMSGLIVTVLRAPVVGETIESQGVFFTVINGEPAWVVRSVGNNGLIPMRSSNGKLYNLSERCIADRLLRPVSGLPDAEHTDEREPIKELA